MSGNPSNTVSNRTERSRIKTSTELTDELELRQRLCAQYRNSFFDVVNLFRLTASAAIVNRYRQRDTRLAAEAQNVIAAHGASTSYAEHKMRIRLTILLELETILCTEYRNSYFTAINLIGASVFNHVGDHHRQRDGVIEAEVARVNDMIERIRYAVD